MVRVEGVFVRGVKIVSPVILHMNFFEAVDTVYETSGYLIHKSNEHDIPAACFATRPKPPGWRRDGEWTGGSKRRREEARQGRGSEAGNGGGRETVSLEGGREGGRTRGRAEEERVSPSNETEE